MFHKYKYCRTICSLNCPFNCDNPTVFSSIIYFLILLMCFINCYSFLNFIVFIKNVITWTVPVNNTETKYFITYCLIDVCFSLFQFVYYFGFIFIISYSFDNTDLFFLSIRFRLLHWYACSYVLSFSTSYKIKKLPISWWSFMSKTPGTP